jgi:adenylosuccinate synthase
MPVLAILRHEEGVRLDPDPLVALFAELGEGGAERVVRRALLELSEQLSDLATHFAEDRTDELMRGARMLAKVAEQVGMATLARVARDVVRTSEAADVNAQAATVARLGRIGQRSLAALWDLGDAGG